MSYQEFVIPELNYTPLSSHLYPKNNNKRALAIFSVLILPLLISTYVTVRAIKYSTVKISATVVQPSPILENNTSSSTLPVGLATNKTFYISGADIYSYDVITKETKQWTQYPAGTTDYFDFKSGKSYIYYSNLQVIDENTVGFAKCEKINADTQCSISSLSLLDQTVTEVEKIPYKLLVHWVDWYDKDTYAYIRLKRSIEEREYKWQLIYKDNNIETFLEDIPVITEGRDGKNYLDVENLSFSPDGNYLLQISTAYPRDEKDFNTYVYDLKHNSKKVLTESSAPNWIDSQTIIFNKAKIGDEDISFHTYNVITEQKEKVPGMDEHDIGAMPVKGGKKMLFMRDMIGSYAAGYYDFETKKKKIFFTGGYPSMWITDDLFMFTQVGKIESFNIEGQGGLANIFSIKENKQIGEISNVRSNGFSTQYRGTYQDSLNLLLL